MMKQKAFAKVNIFLKIIGTRDNYHEILSRFYRVDDLYDEIEFVKTDAKRFEIIGCNGIKREENSIYKAFCALNFYTQNPQIIEFFDRYSVKVTKNIPSFAGLGGGSSDCATFLKMCNDILDLRLSLTQLCEIGATIGADVAFFIKGFKSANVSGIGEIIEEFNDDDLKFDIFTPNVKCSTPIVYKTFRNYFLDKIDEPLAYKLKYLKSKEILQKFDIYQLNDLLHPALKSYPKLKDYIKDGYFFSGSGSSFFKVSSK